MPVILLPTRRAALRAFGACAAAASFARGAERTSHWALLSDTHISAERDSEVRGFHPYPQLEKAVASMEPAKLDGCLIAGDLARLQGTAGDYAQVRSGIAPLTELPIGFCMGNHDQRDNFLAAFASGGAGDRQVLKRKLVAVINRAPVRMILLDSLLATNETPGLLGKEQRTWLDNYLQASDPTPVLLFVHHTLDDGDNSLLDSDRLLRLAARHSKVKAIFYGHSHRYAYDTYEGVHLVNLPSLAYDFSDTQPVGWVDAVFTASGAELTLHALAGNTAADGRMQPLAWRR